jgi:hypothetical protein
MRKSDFVLAGFSFFYRLHGVFYFLVSFFLFFLLVPGWNGGCWSLCCVLVAFSHYFSFQPIVSFLYFHGAGC